jgi:hypothetical protein
LVWELKISGLISSWKLKFKAKAAEKFAKFDGNLFLEANHFGTARFECLATKLAWCIRMALTFEATYMLPQK